MNTPVLLLNANFEPLNVCATRRALGLILAEKAEILVNGRGYVRALRVSIPRPSIIRLGYMVKRPRPVVRLNKREVFRRDHHKCQYCGSQSTRLTIDHVIPRRLGGEYSWENLVTACALCNVKKGGRTLEEANLRLLRPPNQPHDTALYRFGAHLARNQDWKPYLEGW